MQRTICANYKIYWLLLSLLMIIFISGCDKKEHEECAYGLDNIVGVDHFGRSFSPVGAPRENKEVGIFFWPWIGHPYASGTYDATQILAMENGKDLLFYSDNEISPDGQAHFWGEPLWGYYNSDDEWVIRKQIQLLTIAGIDFLVFDTTNALIYTNVFMKILSVIDEYIDKGLNPPKIAFYTHSLSTRTVNWLYRELYQPGHYPRTWYYMDGKPMIIGYTDIEPDKAEAIFRGDHSYDPAPLEEEILDFFTFRKPQWPSDPYFEEGFPWIEWVYPQPIHNGIMSVSVASHPQVPMSFSLTRDFRNWGRGWDPDKEQNIREDVEQGTFFQRQWDQAHLKDPDIVFVGGWNEWIAYKQIYDGEYMLCDAADIEFSRDIEPMKGGYEDAFYIQMIKNIRKYKYSGYDLKTRSVGKEKNYRNIDEYPVERNSYGVSKTITYLEPIPENKLSVINITHNKKRVRFEITCREDILSPDSFNLLIGTGEPTTRGWESYEYLVGENYNNGEVSVGKLNKDFTTTQTGKASYSIRGNKIAFNIPLSVIHMENKERLYFKASAGVKNPSDIMDYYVSGSSMPIGRLSYMYYLN